MICCHWFPAARVTSHQSCQSEWRMARTLLPPTSPSLTATPTAPAPPVCPHSSPATGVSTVRKYFTAQKYFITCSKRNISNKEHVWVCDFSTIKSGLMWKLSLLCWCEIRLVTTQSPLDQVQSSHQTWLGSGQESVHHHTSIHMSTKTPTESYVTSLVPGYLHL